MTPTTAAARTRRQFFYLAIPLRAGIKYPFRESLALILRALMKSCLLICFDLAQGSVLMGELSARRLCRCHLEKNNQI